MVSIGLVVLLLLTTAPVGGASISTASWRDSSEGIHAFLTFDGKSSVQNIMEYGDKIDYVWGSSPSRVSAWRQSVSSNVVLSKYMPFCRDPAPHRTGSPPTGLPWWQKNHPDLVLYRCDKKTPAWECFAGETCSHVSTPLDLTNPKTLEYQMEAGVLPALKVGYNAIALDNYNLKNDWGACGSFSGPNGAWKQLYDAADPKSDVQYGKDVLDWTERAVRRIHEETGMLVIPNYSDMDIGDPQVLEVTNITDGILAESGFTMWNPIPNTTSMYHLPPMTNPEKFEKQVAFVRNLQRHGKGFFSINEWGPGPDYGLNPSCLPGNITKSVREFVVAAYMMTNENSSGVFLTCIQCYGGGCGGEGNFSIWAPEYSAKVGRPVGEPCKQTDAGAYWIRHYTNGLAIVNPSTTDSVSMKLPPLGSHLVWVDLYGKKIAGDEVVHVLPATGKVLLKQEATA